MVICNLHLTVKTVDSSRLGEILTCELITERVYLCIGKWRCLQTDLGLGSCSYVNSTRGIIRI